MHILRTQKNYPTIEYSGYNILAVDIISWIIKVPGFAIFLNYLGGLICFQHISYNIHFIG